MLACEKRISSVHDMTPCGQDRDSRFNGTLVKDFSEIVYWEFLPKRKFNVTLLQFYSTMATTLQEHLIDSVHINSIKNVSGT